MLVKYSQYGFEVQSRLLKWLMVREKCQGVFFQNTLVKFLLKSDSKLYQSNMRVSDCEELVGLSHSKKNCIRISGSRTETKISYEF